MKSRLATLARYNAWADEQLWAKVQAVPDDAFAQDRGAFFGSLGGTLNHIVLATRLWLDRCEGRDFAWFRSLDQILEANRATLRRAMSAEDDRLIAFVEVRDEAALAADVSYQNSRGEAFETPLDWILTHVVNHATHHRGQASDIISGLGCPTPEMDLIAYLRRQGVG